jgi:hypothetical protein
MLLDLFRKRVIGTKIGLALFYAVIFSVGMIIVSGFSLASLAISAGLGFAMGMVLSKDMHKKNQYFFENAANGHIATTRKYNAMFKNGAMPQTKSERAEYEVFLSALEKSSNRSVPVEIAALIFLSLVFILVVLGEGLTLTSLLFGAIIIFAGYGFIRSRNNLKKIESIKRKLG